MSKFTFQAWKGLNFETYGHLVKICSVNVLYLGMELPHDSTNELCRDLFILMQFSRSERSGLAHFHIFFYINQWYRSAA